VLNEALKPKLNPKRTKVRGIPSCLGCEQVCERYPVVGVWDKAVRHSVASWVCWTKRGGIPPWVCGTKRSPPVTARAERVCLRGAGWLASMFWSYALCGGFTHSHSESLPRSHRDVLHCERRSLIRRISPLSRRSHTHTPSSCLPELLVTLIHGSSLIANTHADHDPQRPTHPFELVAIRTLCSRTRTFI
jgi:hypothetical protein